VTALLWTVVLFAPNAGAAELSGEGAQGEGGLPQEALRRMDAVPQVGGGGQRGSKPFEPSGCGVVCVVRCCGATGARGREAGRQAGGRCSLKLVGASPNWWGLHRHSELPPCCPCPPGVGD